MAGDEARSNDLGRFVDYYLRINADNQPAGLPLAGEPETVSS